MTLLEAVTRALHIQGNQFREGECMIDLQAIQTVVDTALKAELEKARAGRAGHVRGSRSRFLLQEEITHFVKTIVKDTYSFDIADVPEYAAMFPDFLTVEIESGPLAHTLANSLITHIARNAATNAQDGVLATNTPAAPQDILADIEDTLKLASDLGPHNRSNILSRSLRICFEEPSVDAYRAVAMDAAVLADTCRKLVYQLDIGDPPRAILAGQIYRRLLEAADQIEFALNVEPDEKFEHSEELTP
jgi:hypothetical protein